MASGDFSVDLAAINSTLSSIEKVLTIDAMQAQFADWVLDADSSANCGQFCEGN